MPLIKPLKIKPMKIKPTKMKYPHTKYMKPKMPGTHLVCVPTPTNPHPINPS